MFNFNLEICLVVLEAVKLGRERILEVHLTLQIKIKVPTFLKAGAGVITTDSDSKIPTDGYEHAKRFI